MRYRSIKKTLARLEAWAGQRQNYSVVTIVSEGKISVRYERIGDDASLRRELFETEEEYNNFISDLKPAEIIMLIDDVPYD